jgi:hypothetical protein
MVGSALAYKRDRSEDEVAATPCEFAETNPPVRRRSIVVIEGVDPKRRAGLNEAIFAKRSHPQHTSKLPMPLR